MRLPWRRSRFEQAEGPEETEKEAQGPAINSYRSPGLHEALAAVPSDGSCRVLDLGPAVSDNVAFISSIAEMLQIVDAFGYGFNEGDVETSRVLAGVATLRSLHQKSPRPFHLVLAWDLFNYLPETRAKEVLEFLAGLCRPGARLHTIVYATDTMPDFPNRYRILGDDSLAYEPVTVNRRGAPSLTPAAVARLLSGFQVEHSFVLRHGVHEYVAARTGLEA